MKPKQCACHHEPSCQECFDADTITLPRIYSDYCQVCGIKHKPIALVYYVRDDNNLCCYECAEKSGLSYQTRIYMEG